MNIFKLDKNLRNFHFDHFSAIPAVLEMFDFEISLLLLLEISLLYDVNNLHYAESRAKSATLKNQSQNDIMNIGPCGAHYHFCF